MSVSRLAQPLDITLAAVVQHLQVLEKSGLLHSEKLEGYAFAAWKPVG